MFRTALRHQRFRGRNLDAGKEHPEWSQRRTAENFGRRWRHNSVTHKLHMGD